MRKRMGEAYAQEAPPFTIESVKSSDPVAMASTSNKWRRSGNMNEIPSVCAKKVARDADCLEIEVTVNEKYKERSKEAIDMLAPFQKMWERHFGNIKLLKQKIFRAGCLLFQVLFISRRYIHARYRTSGGSKTAQHGRFRARWYYRVGDSDRLCPKEGLTFMFLPRQ